jgi:hypothetical protein
MSSDWPYIPAADGARLGGVPLIVKERSSCSTFVELFHRNLLLLGRLLIVVFKSTLFARGDESGVRLRLCLCPGRSGGADAGGSEPRIVKIDVLFSRTLCEVIVGSDDGTRRALLLLFASGVTGGVRVVPVILRANFRNGEIDLDIEFPELGVFEDRGALGGVAR